ncbi:MAG: ATP-dependent 6-phosphofructokinase [Acidimicrobiia bacterium]|nr:ATP-dependent 6-phosphofructokinase [Acidimicrobiia bacterium]MDH3397721.1 ATP-dependent 6-phosphofructokinase [Acidimicrobiia bacterium]
MKRIAVLTSGGDAPGMNAGLLAAVKVATARGVEVLGIERGYDGAIDGQFSPLTRTAGSDLVPIGNLERAGGRGGTLLGSSRCPRFFEPQGRAAAAGQLRRARIGGLLVLGGNGSLTGAHKLAQETGFPVVGIPASIDNDLGCTSDAIGVDSALNTIIEACDRISDTARSHHRAFVVEVMGRDSGYLAMVSAVATAADAALLPEQGMTEAEVIDEVERLVRAGARPDRDKPRILIIKAEGVPVPATRLVREVSERLRDIQVDVRATVLGHIVRGGNPTAHDRLLAGRFAFAAIGALLDGASDVMVAWRPAVVGGAETSDSSVRLFPIAEMLEETAALLDGTSSVTRARLQRMKAAQGVLGL